MFGAFVFIFGHIFTVADKGTVVGLRSLGYKGSYYRALGPKEPRRTPGL